MVMVNDARQYCYLKGSFELKYGGKVYIVFSGKKGDKKIILNEL